MTANFNARSRNLFLLTSLLFLLIFMVASCGEPNDPEPVDTGSSAYELLSTINTWGFAMDVCFDGNRLFVAENSYGMGIYDITELSAPVRIGELPNDSVDMGQPVRVIETAPEWNMIFVEADDEVPIYTLDNLKPSNIYSVLGGKYEMLVTFRQDSVQMNYDNSVQYIDILQVLFADRTSDDCLQKYVYYVDSLDIDGDDILDPDTTYIHPFNGKKYLNTKPRSIDYAGNYDTIVAALDDLGAGIADVSGTQQPGDVTWLGVADTPGSVLSVKYQDGYIYAADGQYGLAIIDASDFTAMETIVSWKLSGLNNAVDIAVQGNYLALADDFDGVFLLDIEDPANPLLIDTFPVRKTNELTFMPDPDGNPVLFIASEEFGVSILELTY